MLCAKHAIPHMAAAGGGSIINTSSNQSLAGDLTQSAYGIAKAGINQLTRTIATQCGRDGIRCNALSPGLILTPAAERSCPPEMQQEIASHSPLGRVGASADLAHAALFLASDESSYVSGQIISVDVDASGRSSQDTEVVLPDLFHEVFFVDVARVTHLASEQLYLQVPIPKCQEIVRDVLVNGVGNVGLRQCCRDAFPSVNEAVDERATVIYQFSLHDIGHLVTVSARQKK